MQTVHTSQAPVSANAQSAFKNRIIAEVVLQEWGGRRAAHAIEIETKFFDVTDDILLLDHCSLTELEDGSEGTDEIGREYTGHSGPIEVRVTDSICQFFSVAQLEDITPAAHAAARRELNPQPPQYLRTLVEVDVTARLQRGATAATAFDDLKIEVSSNVHGVVVTSAQRASRPAGADRIKPAANPSLPVFLQLLAQADALSLDDGPLLTSWTTSEWTDDPMSEALHLSWTDETVDYSTILTEEGIATGAFDGEGRFVTTDHEGELLFIRLFKNQPIVPSMLNVPA